ncbi:hypothetical protein KY290_006344 [Solanum tuberosum]|uniref:Cleavage and polyadenylation specificity factor subunit 2 n=1 Tax=Solanum tuberosum TaxID=4113 RepID=A0ABQ7WGP6_SOLTU|nr:hypothetical protein KY284_006802 [Solanum tuberosum]KAH0724073.1 hypothetical protein KY289_007117 [Solanum tuberosum]KAH0753092.1 hypothetical protein KY285_006240 [Solanum tuberosum]KAH0779917.1 hypothetical protein KY290_006344 [Solanum tuberosum]
MLKGFGEDGTNGEMVRKGRSKKGGNNSVLEAMPTHKMPLFPMPGKIIKKLDAIKRNFLWQEWLWRLVTDDQGLWKEIIAARYGRERPWTTKDVNIPYDAIERTVNVGGNVLLPVDTAGRVLELILTLEQHWTQKQLSTPIYFLSYVSSSTIDYVKSFLEWMSDSIAKSFEHTRDNAFLLRIGFTFICLSFLGFTVSCLSNYKLSSFKIPEVALALPCAEISNGGKSAHRKIKLVINKSALEEAPGSKVVMASMASLEAGFSHDLFVEWAADPKNLVMFTERGQFGTLARLLQSDPPPKAVKVTMSRRIPLVGEELAAYEEEQNRIKREEALKATLVKEEESKASVGAEVVTNDPMAVDTNVTHPSSNASGLHSGAFKDVLIDGFVTTSSSVAPMFPFYDNTSEWDDFGEVINPDDYVVKDDNMEQSLMHVDGDLNGKLDEGSANLILDTTPSKVESSELTVQVKCSLLYMDFEGRSDGRSIKSILAHVAPLKLVNLPICPALVDRVIWYLLLVGGGKYPVELVEVLVHGSAEATEHLKQHCLKHVCPQVYAPQLEETIDVTSDLCAYKVQLSEKLMSQVLFKKLGDYEIAWVDAEVGKTENDMFSLLPLSGPAPPHKTVLVGDLKMSDFKQFLASKGVQVEFGGGALRCGEYVTIRKVGDASQKVGGAAIQQIVLEGPLSEEYYKIREYLYSHFYSL